MIYLGLPTKVVSLLSQDITIGPNSNGLPGNSQLKSIVGASMTVPTPIIISGQWTVTHFCNVPNSSWAKSPRLANSNALTPPS